MSVSRLAIMAGLLTLALAPGTTPAARSERAIEAAPPPQSLSITQMGAEFFIGHPRSSEPADASVSLGNSVRIDQRLLASGAQLHAGDKQ